MGKLIKKMRGVKIVNHNMTSFWDDLPPEIKVKYKKGEMNHPRLNGTKLFFFKDLESAKRYASSYRYFEVEAYNAEEFDKIVSVGYLKGFSWNWANDVFTLLRNVFKRNTTIDRNDSYIDSAPTDTFVCEKMKLIRELT